MKIVHIVLLIIAFSLHGSFYSKSFAQSHENSDSPKFMFPASCTYGQDCWAVNYVDVDGKDGSAQDFKCGPKTYDVHKGTDFALSSIARMRGGVDVLAAADGRVLRFRDGESDRLKSAEEIEDIQGQKKRMQERYSN